MYRRYCLLRAEHWNDLDHQWRDAQVPWCRANLERMSCASRLFEFYQHGHNLHTGVLFEANVTMESCDQKPDHLAFWCL
jgi:hypothetical protein